MAMLPVTVTVELLIGSTWVDISSFVYQRNPITITGGKSASADKAAPATLTFTVNNRDGRFSPLYTGGAYYPNLKRNVQIRVSATATSSSGNYFAGYRFWGEVTRWPPLNDVSGKDVYVDVTAHGPLRRTREGGGQGSALSRYYQMLTGSYAPIAYWPCEEDPRFGGFIATDPGGSQIGTGLPNGMPMNVSAGSPAWKANNSFNGSAPIPVLNGSTWDGLTGSFNSSGDDIYDVAGSYTFVASTTTVNAKVWGGGGGGENGGSGAGGGRGGGGGEFAQNTTLAVTPGNAYTVVVGSGGSGGNYSGAGADIPGQNGRLSKMTGDAASVTGHGGLGGLAAGGGAGGTGSTAPVHHDGGGGGGGSINVGAGGSGGGGSGGTAAAGNVGNAATGNTGNTGGVAVTGGGGGGRGGDAPKNNNADGGHIPGGGGGGGAFGGSAAYAGQGGADGKVELVYTPQTTATTNVIRFVIQVPPHGGNPGNVLLRIKTSSTVLDRLDVTYAAGGKLRLQGFNSSNVQQFDSTALSWTVDGNPLMVSVELVNSGANVAWAFKTITPGSATLRNSASGTVTTAAVGNVTEVTAAPNADITKTAMGHISVQYALIDLRKVSRALHGHHAELGIDRFIRLCNEQAMANVPEFNEAKDHWGFEEGLQGWTATNAAATRSTVTLGNTPWFGPGNGTPADGSNFAASNALAAQLNEGDQFVSDKNPGVIFTVYNVGFPAFGFNRIDIRPMASVIIDSADTVTQVVNTSIDPTGTILFWPSYGAHSMLLTANGAGQPSATGPTGTSGQPVSVGDIVSVATDIYAPTGLPNAYVGIKWYTAAGAACAHAEDDSADQVIDTGDVVTLKAKFTAPATAAFFAATAGDHHTDANGTLIYVDNVRVSPRMGPQTRKALHKFMEEIEDLDQGILKEWKHAWGHGYRTRFRLINQTPVVTLNYAQGMLSPPLAPVVDQQNIRNDITVRRHKGSKRHISDDSGSGAGTPEPPKGAGRKKHLHRVVAEEDAQLAALAQHLLNLGTVTDERYPTVTVNLLRCAIPGHPLAPLMSAIASAEIGDMIQMTNLPFWFPQATAKQLVIGYTENLSPWVWDVTWNCVPESPWEIVATSTRRW